MSSKFPIINSVMAIMALSAQLMPLQVFAQTGDSIVNNGLPIPKPSPTKIVKRMWGGLDIRKGKDIQETAPVRYTIRSENPADIVHNQETNNDTVVRNSEPASLPVSPSATTTGRAAEDISAPSLRPAISTATTPVEQANSTNTNTNTNTAKLSTDNTQPEQVKQTETEKTNIQALETAAAAITETTATESKQVDNKPATEASAPADKVEITTRASANPVSSEQPISSEQPVSGEQPVSNEQPISGEQAVSSSEQPISSEQPVSGEQPIAVAANIMGLSPSSILGGKLQAEFIPDDGTPLIDNDEAVQFKETIKYEELALADGKTKVKAGARFPIVIASQITSKTAKVGDPIEAHLKFDLKIGDRLIAPKGSLVKGHVKYVLKARTIMGSIITLERWYKNSGCLGIAFDELISHKGEHIPLNAIPSREARVIKNKAEGRELGINHDGQIAGPWSTQLRHKAIRVGLNFAMAPAGVFSFGAMPVALGAIGAINPSFAFSKPVGLNVRHRRLKGFFWGFLSGVPGSWLIEDTTVRGQEAIIKPGDEFYAEFTQEWTGEPASEAELLPGAGTKVRGQILDDGKKKKGNKK